MAKKVTFRVYWQEFSDVTIDLPNNIDPNDENKVWEHLENTWDKMGLPITSEYLPDSDEIDREHGFKITE